MPSRKRKSPKRLVKKARLDPLGIRGMMGRPDKRPKDIEDALREAQRGNQSTDSNQ